MHNFLLCLASCELSERLLVQFFITAVLQYISGYSKHDKDLSGDKPKLTRHIPSLDSSKGLY